MSQKSKKNPSSKDIKTISDDYGNLVLCVNNGARIVLNLKLKSEKKTRRIGVINIGQKTIEIKRDSTKHLFKKNRSYGFNYQILNDGKKFDYIRLKDEANEWLIPKKYVLENGKFLFFKGEGFERQIFITLLEIEQFRRTTKI